MGEADSEKDDPSADNPQLPPQRPHTLNQQHASLLVEALDLACDKLFNEISIKAMLDRDDRTLTKKLTPLTQEELATYNTLVDSPDKVHPSVFFPPSPESPTSVVSANVISIQHSADDVVRSQPSAGGCTSPTAPSLPPFPTLEDATTTSAAVGTPSAGGPSPPAPSAGGVPIAARQEGMRGARLSLRPRL
jgi:hypothetical protein